MKTRLSIIAVIISLTLWLGCIAAIAAPIDQNFDNISLGSKGNPSYTQDGITYTTNDGSAQISIVNDGSIASGNDHALSFRSTGKGTTSLVKFKAQDGASFKLNSFVLATGLGNNNLTIKGYRDGQAVVSKSLTTQAPAYTAVFNVANNSQWSDIDEVRMSGTDLDLDLDDLDLANTPGSSYTITYIGNGNTGGAPPVDPTEYLSGEKATALGNTGGLTIPDQTFYVWNTAADGSGTTYWVGNQITIANSDIVLYAKYRLNQPAPTGLTVQSGRIYGTTEAMEYRKSGSSTYLACLNDISPGLTEEQLTPGTYYVRYKAKPGYNSGERATLSVLASGTYTITYNGNGNTGGAPPVDTTEYPSGSTVTILGNTGEMTIPGQTFYVWNTAADGSGTTYWVGNQITILDSDIVLYARYRLNQPAPTGLTVFNKRIVETTDAMEYRKSGSDTYIACQNDVTPSLTEEQLTPGTYYVRYKSKPGYNSGEKAILTIKAGYTVIYNGNGNTAGAPPVDSTEYASGATVTALGNTGGLTIPDQTFYVWNTAADGSGTTYWVGNQFAITNSDIMLYAKYRLNQPAPTGLTVQSGRIYGTTEAMEYRKSGSSTYLACLNDVTPGLTENQLTPGTYYVRYKAKPGYNSGERATLTVLASGTYTVTYNGNGNTGGAPPVDTTEYPSGSTATILGNTGGMSLQDRTFYVWNTAADGSGTTYWVGNSLYILDSNIVLYAQWLINQPAPTGLTVQDGRIYGTTDAMEYRKSGSSTYLTCQNDVTPGLTENQLTPGNYYVRYKEKPGYYKGATVTLTVP